MNPTSPRSLCAEAIVCSTSRPRRRLLSVVAPALFVAAFNLTASSQADAVQPVIYVAADAAGANDGTSWANAYTDLQTGIAVAVAGQEIWVKGGTYKPSSSEESCRGASFHLKNGVGIYGGFAGTENVRGLWPNYGHDTILSGDLNGDDSPDFTSPVSNKGDNSYHVVDGSNTDATAVLSFVTIRDGNASGTGSNNKGGGLFISDGSPTIRSCWFQTDFATCGGACWIQDATGVPVKPRFDRCGFNNNRADNGQGGHVSIHGGDPLFSTCEFQFGYAGMGGAIWNESSGTSLVNCRLCMNYAGDGAAMYNSSASPTLTNCVLDSNYSNGYGGAMFTYNGDPRLTNCTVYRNSSNYGGAVTNHTNCHPVISNSIVWGNINLHGYAANVEETQILTVHDGAPVVNYTCVQGWTGNLGGLGNIPSDPLFGTSQFTPGPGSPCINAGSNAYIAPDIADLDGDGDKDEPVPYSYFWSGSTLPARVIGASVDMGAVEVPASP